LEHVLSRRQKDELRVLQGFLQSLPESIHVVFQDEAFFRLPDEVRRLAFDPVEEPLAPEADVGSLPSISDEILQSDDDLEFTPTGILSPVRFEVQSHEVVWPSQTLLDMEDFLSRAHDIEWFWFFEARDRASSRVAEQRMPAVPLETIEENPPDWPKWKIESARSRSAMRERRKSTTQKHGSSTAEAAPVCAMRH
jgi:hypothetical protein